MVVKVGTEFTLEQDCRIARGGYAGGGGRRRAVSGRVALALRNVAWVPRDFGPDCRIVRGGSLWVVVRRRALAGGRTFGACSRPQVWAFYLRMNS